jgi:hypothetical protein
VQQVAGLTQLAGEFMRVAPLVIDLGWGELKSALTRVKDAGFTSPGDAAKARTALVAEYVEAFRRVEKDDRAGARGTLKDLQARLPTVLTPDAQRDVLVKVDALLGKLG